MCSSCTTSHQTLDQQPPREQMTPVTPSRRHPSQSECLPPQVLSPLWPPSSQGPELHPLPSVFSGPSRPYRKAAQPGRRTPHPPRSRSRTRLDRSRLSLQRRPSQASGASRADSAHLRVQWRRPHYGTVRRSGRRWRCARRRGRGQPGRCRRGRRSGGGLGPGPSRPSGSVHRLRGPQGRPGSGTPSFPGLRTSTPSSCRGPKTSGRPPKTSRPVPPPDRRSRTGTRPALRRSDTPARTSPRTPAPPPAAPPPASPARSARRRSPIGTSRSRSCTSARRRSCPSRPRVRPSSWTMRPRTGRCRWPRTPFRTPRAGGLGSRRPARRSGGRNGDFRFS
mmetsp:Transcript_27653/g.56679  ORF Transcript_27653/g.56679 Transcript_27653/m.56679 type:complete len:336 (-) Transcript_27653:255-1262(-)